MADNSLTIDGTTLEDDADLQQVAFEGEVDGDSYQFAVDYEVLETLSGIVPNEDNALSLFRRYEDAISAAALVALGHDSDRDVIVIGEEDLDGAPEEPGAGEE